MTPEAPTPASGEELRIEGLTSTEAEAALRVHGPNEVAHEKTAPAWLILVGQLKSPVIALLLGACLVSAFVGEAIDAIAIAAIVVLNAIVGFVQEYRAERAIAALRALTAPRARVLRDGHAVDVPAAGVVPGDVLVLDAGDVVAADARLFEANALLVNESALTGESVPVDKTTASVRSDAPLAERSNAVFMGTAVANGSGRAIVVATAMATELGKIAHLLAGATDEVTPLEKRLARVSQVLLVLAILIVGIVALLGFVRGLPPLAIFMSAVSLAVAAVPEGLPAIVAIALAIGVQRMAARHVLVRRLPAVETLGCATVICTDKTGTLTTGVMRVREVWGSDRVLYAAAACSDAELGADGKEGVGDPTELALLIAAAERGIHRSEIERAAPRVRTNPFDPVRKRMSVLRSDGVLYVKGALELLLPLCREGTEGSLEAGADMAARGLRVLAVAVGAGQKEEELTLLGLVGIADPPRAEAIEAVRAARAAGIRTVMVTGDHRGTAEAIGRELGILGATDSPEQVIHARATPEDKIEIVRMWKARGDVVAMTGDGVNDAPALREAHIGIAMGRTGTEVSREASDMVLADDNFASIVAAIREGRGIFDNIRKTLVYLLAGNASELLVMLGAAIAGLPVPLLPLHLLWINLVTDGLPALALVMDPVEADAMARPPRKPDEPMLGLREWSLIGLTGVLESSIALGVFIWGLSVRDVEYARNLTFCVLVLCELFRAFAARSPKLLFFEVGAFTNLRLLGVIAVSALLQLGLHSIPFARAFFETSPLSGMDWGLAVLLGLVPVSVLELAKLFRRVGRAAA